MNKYGLNFDEGKILLTTKGRKYVYTAYPNEDFWVQWRENKTALKAEGVSVSKFEDEWVVYLWADIPKHIVEEQKKWEKLSRSADDSGIQLKHPEGLNYLNYQNVGIQYAINKKNVIIGDEMGLGKTIQAIGVINNTEVSKIIIFCPASLKINWYRELQRWLTRELTIAIINTKSTREDLNKNILIVNYDIAKKMEPQLSDTYYHLKICDESHYLKNYKSQRTQSVTAIKSARTLLLTGTPMLNRPVELLTQIEIIGALKYFNGNRFRFLERYCVDETCTKYSRFVGAAHLDELSEILRQNCFIARKKADVLADLPPKFRKIVKIDDAEVSAREQKRMAVFHEQIEEYKKTLAKIKKQTAGSKEDYKKAVDEIRSVRISEISEISEIRHETAIAKIPHVIEYITEFMCSTNRKLVVFAHHLDVIDALYAEFKDLSVKFHGGMSEQNKQRAIDTFQNDPKCWLFIGSLHAASMGITLTAASDVLFAEIDWTPAILSQAEDRCHRVGQKNYVSVQHLIFDNSIDGMLLETIIEKQKILDEFDGEEHAAN